MMSRFNKIFILLAGIILPASIFLSCEPNAIEVDAPDAFIKFYGGRDQQEGFSVKQTPDGGFVILGSTNSFGYGGWDIYLIKVDNAGNEEWSNTYGGTGDDRGKSLLVEDDGTYIVLGDYQREVLLLGGPKMHTDMYLLKISSGGQQIDSAFFGNNRSGIAEHSDEIGKEVQKASDAGYVIVGSTTNWDITGDTPQDSIQNAPTDFYLVKTKNGFEFDWENAKGFPGEDIANSVVQFDESTFLITGSTADGAGGISDMFVAKVRNDFGAIVGKTNFGDNDVDIGNRIIKTTGGYAVIGTTFSGNNPNAFLSKIDLDGNEIVDSKYIKIGDQKNEGNDIQPLEGGFLILGTVTTDEGKEFYLVKTDLDGKVIWEKEIGGVGDDEGHGVISTGDGFVLVGNSTFFEPTNNTMINLIKTNKDGAIIR